MWEALVATGKLRSAPKQHVPVPFSDPPPDWDLDKLVEEKFYRAAVAKTAEILAAHPHPTESDLPAIFDAWYARCRCLLLLKQGSQVAEEVRVCLRDLDSQELRELDLDVHWNLRLLLLPAFTGGINQHTVQRLYLLAIEAREAVAAGKHAAKWTDRLRDLGLYVAAALLAMKDFATALAHLEAMHEAEVESDVAGGGADTAFLLALINVQLGDSSAAKDWLAKANGDQETKDVVEALCTFVDGDYESLKHQKGASTLSTSGLANLHTGQVDEAIKILEQLVAEAPPNTTTLYNLFVMYDLDRTSSKHLKSEVAKTIHGRGIRSLGNYDVFAQTI